MANQVNTFSHTFPAAASSGILPRRGLVMDASNRGDVKMPASSPEATFVGVALETVSKANNVEVQMAGIAIMESDGSAVINPGDYLILVGTTGRVKSQALADGTTAYNVIGKCVDDGQIAATAGLYVSVHLHPFVTFGA